MGIDGRHIAAAEVEDFTQVFEFPCPENPFPERRGFREYRAPEPKLVHTTDRLHSSW